MSVFKTLNVKKKEFVKRKHGELFLVSAFQDYVLTQASFGRRIPIWSCQRGNVSLWHMDPSSGLNAGRDYFNEKYFKNSKFLLGSISTIFYLSFFTQSTADF